MKNVIALLFFLPLASCGPDHNSSLMNSQPEDASIVGGQVVDKEIFAKHVVALYDLKQGVLCTGTLISKNLVLTAAHCADEGVASDYEVYFTKSARSDRAVARPVSNIRVHSYNPKSYADRNDLAIVRFEGGLPPGYEPMPLPTKNDLMNAGRKFYATGFGTVTGRKDLVDRQSGILRYTELMISESELTTKMGQFTASQRLGHGICFGDSGGPAFVKLNNHRRVLIGVASAVYSLDPDARKKPDFDVCRHQAIYMSTYYHLPWIQKASAELAVASGPY